METRRLGFLKRLACVFALFCAFAGAPAQEVQRQVESNYQTHIALIASLLKAPPAKDADTVLPTAWLNCFYLRDLDSARRLADAASLAQFGFWKEAFYILGGGRRDRLEVLRRFPEKQAVSPETRQIMGMLFSIRELTQSSNPGVRAVADPLGPPFSESRATPAALYERMGRAGAAHLDAESLRLAEQLPVAKMGTPDIVSMAMSAVASCHYAESESFYAVAKERVGALKMEHRDPSSGGLAFIYLVFYMGRPLSISPEGQVTADGIPMPIQKDLGAIEKFVSMQQIIKKS